MNLFLLRFRRSNSSGSSVNSPGALPTSSSTAAVAAAAMANPYSMGPLSYHSPSVQSYCSPADNLSLAGHYTDMRSSAAAGWYGTTTNDPRFASKRIILGFPSTSFLWEIKSGNGKWKRRWRRKSANNGDEPLDKQWILRIFPKFAGFFVSAIYFR